MPIVHIITFDIIQLIRTSKFLIPIKHHQKLSNTQEFNRSAEASENNRHSKRGIIGSIIIGQTTTTHCWKINWNPIYEKRSVRSPTPTHEEDIVFVYRRSRADGAHSSHHSQSSRSWQTIISIDHRMLAYCNGIFA